MILDSAGRDEWPLGLLPEPGRSAGQLALVVDANILVRAVHGRRVLALLTTYIGPVAFTCPTVAFNELHLAHRENC
jgi:hypothetical protein